ncbi:MAG: carboxylating nicotinate-nucleotide diphosphorylase [Actinomycetota bacterium]
MKVDLPDTATDLIVLAYAEDLGTEGDITTSSVTDPRTRSVGRVVARQSGCIAGLGIAGACFTYVDRDVEVELHCNDGDYVEAGTSLLTVSGMTASILTAERVALNFLGWLSGIATATNTYVRAVEGTEAVVSDTRKTTPGMRTLERYAVSMGGGRNHRFGLFDAVLIKDNHLATAASIAHTVEAARTAVGPEITVEVEVDTIAQLEQVLDTDADVVLLDNMTIEDLAEAVRLVDGRLITEASGGVTLETISDIARTGVDVISTGWITHSAPALDVALDLDPH